MENKVMQLAATANIHTPEEMAAYRALAAALTTPILQKIEMESIMQQLFVAGDDKEWHLSRIMAATKYYYYHTCLGAIFIDYAMRLRDEIVGYELTDIN